MPIYQGEKLVSGSAVSSFNGRAGAVLPQAGDYSAKMVGAQAVPNFTVITMLASSWNENTYSFETVYPHASYDISIEVAPTATADQYEAFCAAFICGSTDSTIVTALGDVPTADIPIIVKAVRK